MRFRPCLVVLLFKRSFLLLCRNCWFRFLFSFTWSPPPFPELLHKGQIGVPVLPGGRGQRLHDISLRRVFPAHALRGLLAGRS